MSDPVIDVAFVEVCPPESARTVPEGEILDTVIERQEAAANRLDPQSALWLARGFLAVVFLVPALLLAATPAPSPTAGPRRHDEILSRAATALERTKIPGPEHIEVAARQSEVVTPLADDRGRVVIASLAEAPRGRSAASEALVRPAGGSLAAAVHADSGMEAVAAQVPARSATLFRPLDLSAGSATGSKALPQSRPGPGPTVAPPRAATAGRSWARGAEATHTTQRPVRRHVSLLQSRPVSRAISRGVRHTVYGVRRVFRGIF